MSFLSDAYKGDLYLIYEWLQPIPIQITQVVSPKIVHTPLTLIFKILLVAYFFFF